MDASFWHERWERNEIAFHEGQPNPLLVTYFSKLSLADKARVFVPLCGKTLDIHWLLAQGHRVVGAELSQRAIEQLFAELDIKPTIVPSDKFIRYTADNIEIFVGDIFNVSRDDVGAVDAIYDRAALVALPDLIRNRYTAHVMAITDRAPQLLICFNYDQSLINGPPFAIDSAEVAEQYGDWYDLKLLSTTQFSGGLKGRAAAVEDVWLLTPLV